MPPAYSRTSQRLPLEVCETVIGFIDSPYDEVDDQNKYEASDVRSRRKRTLYSCALVCRSWVPKARICLLRSVKVGNGRTAASFTASLQATRPLGVYVHELSIGVEDHKERDDPPDGGESGPTGSTSASGWIYQFVQVLPPLLPKLERLEYWNLPILHPLFYSLSSKFTSIQSLYLSDFRTQSFRDILQLINRCKNLQKLTVSECHWQLPSSFSPSRYGQRCLTDFALNLTSRECENDMCNWLTRSRITCTIEELHITNIYDDGDTHPRPPAPFLTPYLGGLLESCATTLRTLVLGFQGTIVPFGLEPETMSLPSLESCIHLEVLKIRLTLWSSNIRWFLRPLPTSLPTSLRNIALQFEAPWDEVFEEENKALWKQIDVALSHRQFSKLTQFEISWDMDDEKELKDHIIALHHQGMFKEVFPGLTRRGILWCGNSWGEDVGSKYFDVETVLVSQIEKSEKSKTLATAWKPVSQKSLFQYEYATGYS